MPCNHPASALKLEAVTQAEHALRVKFICGDCLTPITKEYMGHAPEQSADLAVSEMAYFPR